MRREKIRNKLHKMISGQVQSYINDHPEHIHPNVVPTLPGSLAKRISGELAAKGFVFDVDSIKRRS
jgi:hypothetical protein